MHIRRITIRNFKSIDSLTIKDIESTLILVGQNNVGKSSILDGVKIVSGNYEPSPFDFHGNGMPIEIKLDLVIDDDDLYNMYKLGKISSHSDYDIWYREFLTMLPTYKDGVVTIICEVTSSGEKRYTDGIGENPYLRDVMPDLYVIDEKRQLNRLHDSLIHFESREELNRIKDNSCLLRPRDACNQCFECMPDILEKKGGELSLHESLMLVKYNFYQKNLKRYAERVNEFFKINYGQNHVIQYQYDFDFEGMLSMKTVAKNLNNGHAMDMYTASNSLKSLYILSLFQAYIALAERSMNIIIMEQPELHLHPELQKVTADILFRLSKKNQVLFTTHSPNMIQNFSDSQIRQVGLNKLHRTIIKGPTDVDRILGDLGQTASDLMNVSFVFIVEGKDDRSKLPLLLETFYSGIRDEEGNLSRIAIIPTNSCTNIKTYANLKFINKTFLKDNFLIIRDSDGKDREELVRHLTSYYDQRRIYDDAKIPRITPNNVLILKYYSIENYFLDPEIMVQLGIIKDIESFYEILYSKYTQYLYKLRSTKHMKRQTGLWFDGPEDIKANIETIKVYVRGHNLYDIFYSRYSKKEQLNLMQDYIRLAPREAFEDILDSIDSFVYFINRVRKTEDQTED